MTTITDVVPTDSLAVEACSALLGHTVLGFDAEAKPAFAKGEVCNGPHLIQLATEQRGYLFPVRPCLDACGACRVQLVGAETASGNGRLGLSAAAGPGT